MKLGICGLTGAGRETVFNALTNNAGTSNDDRIASAQVPDDRMDQLSIMYQPLKTIHARVEYILPIRNQGPIAGALRDCDALIHVVRNFRGYHDPPKPLDDFKIYDQELMLTDLAVVEKRLERLRLDKKRGTIADPKEIPLLEACQKQLEQELPLRSLPEVANQPCLRGYAFVSAKPMLILFNNEEDDDVLPKFKHKNCMVIRAKLEQELGLMSAEDAADFLAEFNISDPAMDRVIRASYTLLGLISFFTVGQDEVRAWTIKEDTWAQKAAGAVHSDIEKGFIRAELVAYDDLIKCGSYADAKKKGWVRLEGKSYPVKDGDIINFRFNV